MEIRSPIVAILALGILILVYLRKTVPQLYSARLFFGFLVVAFINVLIEIIECFVFTDMTGAFKSLRKTMQWLYASSTLISIYSIWIYAYSKITKNRIVSNVLVVLTAIPMFISVVTLFFGKIEYGRSKTGYYYNYGPMITLCYVIGLTYIIVTIISVFIQRSRLRREDFFALEGALILWVFLGLLQSLKKGVQVSSIAMMLMGLILFLVIENPKELYEKSIINVKTKDAFTLLLLELFGLKRNFYIISVIFTGKTNVLSASDTKELRAVQKTIADYGRVRLGTSAYLTDWNTLSFIVKKTDRIEEFMDFINNYDGGGGNYKLTFSILEIPKYSQKADETLQILSYVSCEYINTQSSPNLVITEAVVDKMLYRNTIEDVVRKAVKEKAFEVYYQPILKVEDGSFSSAEALVRLRRTNSENYISPEDFIPIAEKCGLILEIDDLVFEKVCSFIAENNLSSYGIKAIEVNLSGNEVVDFQAYDRLIRKMEKYHIPPNFINFEITETAYINNDEAFKENVRKLKEKGSTFSMDDFGSGYSNLLEILKMDYRIVKMDKEFIWNCLDKNKPENMKMLKYTVKFLKDYGLHILAEGVETLEQAEILIENGVEYLQGFYYSRPIPEKEYIKFLTDLKGEKR